MEFMFDLMKLTQTEGQCEDETASGSPPFSRLPLMAGRSSDFEATLKNGMDFASALSLPQTNIQGLLQSTDVFQLSSANSSFTEPDTTQKTNAHVLDLQNKLLCLQQQLNAAVTANYTKNIMIEQLDKILARIMEGWKKHEAEKSERITVLEQEYNDTKEALEAKQKVLVKTEEELGQTLENLMVCQKEILKAQEERYRLIDDHQTALKNVEELYQTKQTQMQQDADELRETVTEQIEVIAGLKQQLQMEQERCQALEDEKNDCVEKTIAEVRKVHQDLIEAKQTEKALLEQVQRQKLEMNDTLREKESLKVEISITQDRIESEKQAQEIKLKQEFANVIKALDARLDKVQEKLACDHSAELQKAHTEHLQAVEAEIQKRIHLEAKLKEEFQRQLQENDTNFKAKLNEALNEKELRLQKLSAKLIQLQQMNDLLASGRSQLMSKFQQLLQSQWQEALGILYGKVDPALTLSLDYPLPSGFMTESIQRELGTVKSNTCDRDCLLTGCNQYTGSNLQRDNLNDCCGGKNTRDGSKTCYTKQSLQITPCKEKSRMESQLYSRLIHHSPNPAGPFLFDVNHCSPLSTRTEISCYHPFPNENSCNALSALRQPSANMSEFGQIPASIEGSSGIFDWLSCQPYCPRNTAATNLCTEMPEKLCSNGATSEPPVCQSKSIYHSCSVHKQTGKLRREGDRIMSTTCASQQLSNKNLRDSGISVTENQQTERHVGTRVMFPAPELSSIDCVSKMYDVISSKTSGSQQSSVPPQQLSSRECSRNSSDAEGHSGQHYGGSGAERLNLQHPYSTPMQDFSADHDRKKQLHVYLEKLLQKPPRKMQDNLDTKPCRDLGKKEHATNGHEQHPSQNTTSVYKLV